MGVRLRLCKSPLSCQWIPWSHTHLGSLPALPLAALRPQEAEVGYRFLSGFVFGIYVKCLVQQAVSPRDPNMSHNLGPCPSWPYASRVFHALCYPPICTPLTKVSALPLIRMFLLPGRSFFCFRESSCWPSRAQCEVAASLCIFPEAPAAPSLYLHPVLSSARHTSSCLRLPSGFKVERSGA